LQQRILFRVPELLVERIDKSSAQAAVKGRPECGELKNLHG
jgi:hypothetical protein